MSLRYLSNYLRYIIGSTAWLPEVCTSKVDKQAACLPACLPAFLGQLYGVICVWSASQIVAAVAVL